MRNYEVIQDVSLKEALKEYYNETTIFEKVAIDSFEVSFQQGTLFDFKEGLDQLKDQKVLIVGDFDCDGILSTTILKALLSHLKIEHKHYIPSRENEGYGLKNEIVLKAKNAQFDAIIAIDNGIVANEAINYAKELGLKVLVIDHHEYESLPNADYILHPNLLEEGYNKCCATALVYLLSCLYMRSDLLLVYAAIATCGDQMEVFGYNRYLIKEGLNLLNCHYFPTICTLAAKKKFDYDDFHFNIVPKINAFSRLNMDRDVNDLVHYFLLEDEEKILSKGAIFQEINQIRKDRSRFMYEEAIKSIQDEPLILIVHSAFQEGLVGLLASRLSAEYHKPSLIFAYNPKSGLYKGSGRGTENFNLYAYLKESNLSFTHFGGHKMAVGLSVSEEELSALKDYLFNHPPIIEEMKTRVIALKEEDLKFETLKLIEDLKPFGTGLKEPLFYLDKPKIQSAFLIKQLYPKYTINNEFEAIYFKDCCLLKEVEYFIGTIHRNQYRKNGISFQIEDCK